MQQTTLLLNHPVLLLAKRVRDSSESGTPHEGLTISNVKRLLERTDVKALLVPERIIAVDTLLTGDSGAQRHVDFLDWELTNPDLAVIAALNEAASLLRKNDRLRLRTAMSFGQRASDAHFIEEATEAYRRAIAIATRIKDPTSVARASLLLSGIFYQRGDVQAAQATLTDAASYPDLPRNQMTEVLLAEASICLEIGSFVKAAALTNEAVKTQSSWAVLWAGETLKERSQLQLGRIFAKGGRIDEAISVLESANQGTSNLEIGLELHQLYLRRGDQSSARSLIEQFSSGEESKQGQVNFAVEALTDIGELSRAAKTLEKTLHGGRESLKDADVLAGYQRLCRIYGRFNDVLGVHNAFHAAWKTLQHSRQRIAEAKLWRIYAESLFDCGAFPEADKAISQAVDTFREFGLKVLETECLLIRGNVQGRRRRYRRSDETFRQVRLRAEELATPDLLLEGLLCPIELCLQRQEPTKVSESDLEHVLRVARDSTNCPGEARVLNAMGKRLLLAADCTQDKIRAAKRYFEEAKEVCRNIGRPDLLRTALENLGWCSEQNQEIEGRSLARAYYKEAIDSYFAARAVLPPVYEEAVGSPLRLAVDESSKFALNRAIRLASLEEDVAEVVRLSEQKRAQTLCEWIKGDELVGSTTRLEHLTTSFRPLPGEAVLMFAAFRDYQYSIERSEGLLAVILLDTGKLHMIELDGSLVRRAINQFENSLQTAAAAFQSPNSSPSVALETREPFIASLLNVSHSLLPSSIFKIVSAAKASCLTVIPDPTLAKVPFAALLNPDTSHHLIEDFEITAAPSLETLAMCREKEQLAFPPVFLGVAQPSGTTLAASGDADFVRQEILPHFAENSRTLSGADASQQNFVDLAPQADVIHMMLHGRAASHASPLEVPTLEFANSDWLSPDEEFSSESLLQLVRRGKRFPRCQLLTMNVCFSADFASVGTMSSGDIGGFPASLLALGAPAIVGASWRLYSKLGHLFFGHLYECLLVRGMNFSKSVRESLLFVKNYQGPNGDWDTAFYDHPYLWGCLMLIGDGGRRL